jgi:hypothetical protein
MPKNPVRAARQAGRQAVRTAKVANRLDERAIKTTAKVEKIATKTASKVAKIKAAAPKKAASEPMEKLEAKGIGKLAMPKSSTGLVPVSTKPRSMTTVAKGMKPTKKSGSTTKAKTGPKLTPQGKAAVAKADAARYRKDQEKGAYVTTPENRNQYQKDKVTVDNVKGTVNKLKAAQDRILAESKANPKTEGKYAESDRKAWAALDARRAKLGLPPMKRKMGGSAAKYQMGGKVDPYTIKPTATAPMYKRSGTTLSKNSDGTYSKKKMGGTIKRKK